MSHDDARRLERILRREGHLNDFVLMALKEMSREEFGLVLYRAMEFRRTHRQQDEAAHPEPESTPHEITVEDGREIFLGHLRVLANYWAKESRAPSPKEKLEGLVHSILATFDGCSGGMPAFDLVPSPHEDDQSYHEENEENWWGSTAINSTAHLHDHWHERPVLHKPERDEA